MNYQNIYMKIIINRQNNPVEGYTENHHIMPKSIFPEYKNLKENPWNSVKLTGREHFICHVLLAKIYNHHSLNCAARMMINFKKYNSKDYEWLRKNYSMCGKIFTEEHKNNISKTWIKRNENKDVEKRSNSATQGEETKRKQREELFKVILDIIFISNSVTFVKYNLVIRPGDNFKKYYNPTDDTYHNIAIGSKIPNGYILGSRPHSEEHIKKIGDSSRGNKFVTNGKENKKFKSLDLALNFLEENQDWRLGQMRHNSRPKGLVYKNSKIL